MRSLRRCAIFTLLFLTTPLWADEPIVVGPKGSYPQQLVVDAVQQRLFVLSAKDFSDPDNSQASITAVDLKSGQSFVALLPEGSYWPQQMVLHNGFLYVTLMYGAVEPGQYYDEGEPIVVRFEADSFITQDEKVKTLTIDAENTVAIQDERLSAHSAYGLLVHGDTLFFTLCSQDTTMQGNVCYGPSRLGVVNLKSNEQGEMHLPGDHKNPVGLFSMGTPNSARLAILSTNSNRSRLNFLTQQAGNWLPEQLEKSVTGYAGKLALVTTEAAASAALVCLSMERELSLVSLSGPEAIEQIPFAKERGDCGDVAVAGGKVAVADNVTGTLVVGQIAAKTLMDDKAKRVSILKKGRIMDVEPFDGGWMVLYADGDHFGKVKFVAP